MALISVAKAASLVNRDRKVLYRDYIATGRITVTKNARGHMQLDTAELLRVFGAFESSTTNQDTTPLEETSIETKIELEKLRAENAALRDKVETQAANLDDLRQALKMLEYKPQKRRSWWFF
jgi:serine kinase of HPr protein (carbohydrate metabolism regulator)